MKVEYSKPIAKLAILWLCIFALAHVVAAASSTFSADTQREQQIPTWPPSESVGLWFERVWFAPFERWDTEHYMKIAEYGYSAVDGTAQFHPLFPLTARFLTVLGIAPLVSLSVVACISGMTFLGVLYYWARLDSGPKPGWVTVFLFMTSPFAWVLVLPYSESLFLLMTGLCFVLMRKQRWFWAGLAGALATLTRQQGLFLIVPMIIAIGRTHSWKWHVMLSKWKYWVATLLIPFAYGGWIAYRALALRDVTLDVSSPIDFVYSVLISPSAVEIVPHQTFVWPWQAFSFALRRTIQAPDIDMIINLGAAALFLLLTGISWRRMKLGSKVFTLIIILLSFSYVTGPDHPYMGLPRHLLLAVPVFVALGRSVTSFLWQLILISTGLVGQMFLVMAFVLRIWVP